MRSVKLLIPGTPVAWQRVGVNFGMSKFYDRQRKDKIDFAVQLANQFNGPLFSNPIAIDFIFKFKSSRTNKNRIWHVERPDLDNCIKYLLDAMKAIVITDDRICSKITAVKLFDNESSTEIIISEI